MKGKIQSIDIDDNIGTLCDSNGNEIPFSLDDCVGFEDTPRILEEVEFGVSGGEIYFVEPANKKQSTPKTIAFEETSITPKEKRKKRDYASDIPLSVSIKDCIDEHFDDVSYSIEEYEASFEEHEELNYALMKRFLNTAYNNLMDMDSSFMDEELVGLHSDLLALDKLYTQLLKKESVPKIAYEKIFLDRQKIYKENKKRLESNSSELFTLESSAKTLYTQIQDIEKRLNDGKSQQISQELEFDLKRYKTYYVDTLHKMGTLKDENIVLKESLSKFESKYEATFLELYEEASKQCFSLLKRQLDGYAYVFDQKMWERAETSSSIIAFFKKAHIEEEFSSKTFLKYFIKTLDKNKMSKELKRLEDLLYYLESRAKKRFLIVEESLSEAENLKHLLRSFDKDFNVESVDKPRSIYYRRDLKIMDFIFIEYGLKNPPLKDFLSMLRVRVKQIGSKAKICVIVKNANKDIISSIKKLGISHIVTLQVPEQELEQSLLSIIESI